MNRVTFLAPRLEAMILAGTLLCSCSSRFPHQALDYNRSVQKHRNEMLLLNVLRGMDREMMTLTHFSILRGDTTGKLTGGIDFPFGPSSVGPHMGEAGSELTTNPSFDLAITDNSAAFVKGFHTGVSLETVEHLVDQGWNKEVLAYLLVERIERNGDSETFRNDPEDATFDDFMESVEVFAKGTDFDPKQESDTVFWGTSDEIKAYTLAKQQGIKLERSRPKQEDDIKVTEPESKKLSLPLHGKPANLVFRSPQGVLYYLGELARAQIQNEMDLDKLPKIADAESNEKSPLFIVKPLSKCKGHPLVTVRHRGQMYCIPSRRDSRSLQCLSLVQQLIMLQQEEKKELTTPTVKVVGG